jgi:hypothetical protein
MENLAGDKLLAGAQCLLAIKKKSNAGELLEQAWRHAFDCFFDEFHWKKFGGNQ